MKLSISNIAWDAAYDLQMYDFMAEMEFSGIEIAPTRFFPESPYEHWQEAKKLSDKLRTEYGLVVSSMQSIWYGRQERIFGEKKDRKILFEYTRKAVFFAEHIGCKNLVFGCPKNRNRTLNVDAQIGQEFLAQIADLALQHHTVIGMEANPVLYHTNYITRTMEALELVRRIQSEGFQLNLDLGTMIYNREDLNILRDQVDLIHHVHISEPELKIVQKRKMHEELAQILHDEGYQGFVSIEMGCVDDINTVKRIMQYVKEVFTGK